MVSVSGFLGLRKVQILLATGIASELVYLLYFVRQFPLVRYYNTDIDMGAITQHSHQGFWLFVGLFTVLFALSGTAWMVLRDATDRRILWLVLAIGAIFALTMTFAYPMTAIDLYAYVGESRIMVLYHQNPIFVPPSYFPNDPVMALSDGWKGSGAPYGPLGVVIDAIPTLLTGRNLLGNIILLKLMFSSILLFEAFLVHQVLYRLQPRLAIAGALFVAWNPLLIFEVSTNSHNDVVMMLFTLLAVLSMVEGEYTVGPVLLVASVLVKYATVLLLPLFLIFGLARQPTVRKRVDYAVITAACMLLLASVAYIPFWQGPSTLTHLTAQIQRYIDSFSTVFMDLSGGRVALEQAALLGRMLFALVYLYGLVLALRGLPDLLRASFLVMFSFLALGVTNFETWYAIWPVVLAAVVPIAVESVAMLLFTYGAAISASFYGYLWVWLGLGTPGSYSIVNNLSYLVTFLPAALLLAALWWRPLASVVRQHAGIAPRPVDT